MPTIVDELDSVIRKVRYWPEQIPFVHALNLAAADNSIFSLARLPQPIILDGLSLVRNTAVIARLRHNKVYREIKAGALLDIAEINPAWLRATEDISLGLHATTTVSDYKVYSGLWVIRPNIAQKLAWKIALTNSERRIAAEKGLENSVKKGVLPFPIKYQIERGYLGYREPLAAIVPSAPANETTHVATLHPERPDEFLVLEGLSADNTGLSLTDNVALYVTRDEDHDLLKLPTFAMSLDYTIPCFIVALHDLRIEVYTESALTNYLVRYTVGRYRFTDTLQARWFEEEMREAMPEFVDTIRAGVTP